MPSAVSYVEGSSIPKWRSGPKAVGRTYSTAQESTFGQADESPPRLPLSNRVTKNKHGSGTNKPSSETSRTPRHTMHQDSSAQKQALPEQPSISSPWERPRSSSGTVASGKRKAGIAAVPRAARRRKVEPSTEMEDEAYMRRTLSLPAKEQYPHLPTGLLETPKSVFHNATQGLMRLHSAFPLVTHSRCQCKLICNIPSREPITALGEGLSKVGFPMIDELRSIAKDVV